MLLRFPPLDRQDRGISLLVSARKATEPSNDFTLSCPAEQAVRLHFSADLQRDLFGWSYLDTVLNQNFWSGRIPAGL